MSNAQSRGWGPGWPTNRIADMVWVRAPISGARWQVHREVAPILSYVVAEAERRGYLFDHGPTDTDDDWGFSSRPIRGTRTPSNHSWGLAVDIDAQNYPQGQRKRIPPAWLTSLFSQWGWSNGAGWSYADPMHYEFLGTPAQARMFVAMLAAGLNKPYPVPVPPGTPSPTPNPITPNRLDGGSSDMVLRNVQDGAIWAVSATHMHHLTGDEWKARSDLEKVTPFPVQPLYLIGLAKAGRKVV